MHWLAIFLSLISILLCIILAHFVTKIILENRDILHFRNKMAKSYVLLPNATILRLHTIKAVLGCIVFTLPSCFMIFSLHETVSISKSIVIIIGFTVGQFCLLDLIHNIKCKTITMNTKS